MSHPGSHGLPARLLLELNADASNQAFATALYSPERNYSAHQEQRIAHGSDRPGHH